MFAPRGWLQGRGNRAMYRTIESSGLFDKSFYRTQDLTLRERLSDPIWHYLRVGAMRGLNPSPSFNTDFYREWNKDVAAAKVNPFEHYLSYGEEEGRPPVKPLAAWHPGPTSVLEPIKFYDSVPATPSRVSLVLDAATPQRWPGDTEVLILAAAWFASGLGRRLRVLRRHGGPAIPAVDIPTLRWPEKFDRPIVTDIPGGIHYSDIEKSPDEIFLASSWSSATVLSRALGGSQLGYLVLEDEAALLPAGEARRLATASLSLEDVTYISAADIADHLNLTRDLSTQNIVTEGALNYGTYLVEHRPVEGGSILVWAGDDLSASHSRCALEAIEKTIQSGLLDPSETPIVLAGAISEPLLLLGTHQVAPVIASSTDETRRLISSASLVCALGGTGAEHPVGRLAGELGIPAVTGLSGDLTLESVVDGLSESLEAKLAKSAIPFGERGQNLLEKFATECRAKWA